MTVPARPIAEPGKREALWVGLCCLVGALHMAAYVGPFDDAYISFRYARHVAEGLGYVYNAGERVEGFTCFGWVTLLAGFAALGAPLPVVATALSAAGGLALVVLAAVLTRRWAPGSRFWPLGPALVAAQGSWAYYAMTGMETTLACALLLGALLVCLQPGRGQGAGAGLLFAAATLMRPEAVGYFGLTAAVLATEKPWRRHLPLLAGSYAAVAVPFILWRWRYFGHPLPNTFYAKAAGGSGLLGAGWAHLEQFFTLHAFWLAPIALVLVARKRGLDLRVKLFAAWLAGAAVNVLVVGGDAFAFYRFFLPIVPIGAALMVSLVDSLHDRLQRSGAALRASVACAVALLAVTAAAELVPRVTLRGYAGPSNYRLVRSVARIARDQLTIGRWLRQQVPPDTRLAINPAGIVPYESGLPTIDMLGLTDAHIAHRPLQVGSGARGHEKHDAAYVLGREPDLILPGLPDVSVRPLQAQDLGHWFGRWFEFLPGDRELFANPQLAERYRGLTVMVAPGRYLTLFVLRRRFDRLFPRPP